MNSVTNRRTVALVVLVVLVVLSGAPISVHLGGPVGQARGATCTTVSSATVISSPGCYVIDGDVEEHEDGDYVEIAASDVVLDGGGHTLDGDGGDNAVHVDGSYSNVTVRNLRLTDWDRAVFVKDVTDATVRDVVSRSSKQGLELDGTSGATVDNVSATANTEYGLYLKDTGDTTVVDSSVTENSRHGLFVDGGDVTVRNVVARSNTEHGVHVRQADGSRLERVTAENNALHGVSFEDVIDGQVVDSRADDNGDAGVRVHHSDGSLVRNVTADSNAHGVHLSSPTTTLNDSRFVGNDEGVRLQKHVHTVDNVTVESSTSYGFFLDEPDDNVVRSSRINASGTAGVYFPDDKPENNLLYDNYLNNSDNVRFGGSVPPTDWNVSRRTGTNVVGGSLVGGNYWAAPDGNGPSQLYDNDDGDAFLDTPYTVGTGSSDAYPLTDVTDAFVVTPAPYDFGSVAYTSTTTQSFTVESRVAGGATVDAFDLTGDTGSFAVSTDPSPTTLSAGETASVEVTLGPVTTGTLTATLVTNASTDAYDVETALTATVADDTPPSAATGGDVTVDEDTSVGFDGSGSTDNVGIASYEWDFGDGTTGEGETTTHTYEDPGTYTATLTVTDLSGNTDTAQRSITVTDVTAPTADAGANRTVHVNTGVSFDGGDSTDNVGVTAYSWAFGDSSGTDGETVTHTYTSTGTYTVELTVSDAAGNTDTDTATIDVVDTTSPLARPGPDRTVDEDTSVAFDGSASTDSDGSIVSYDWAFGTVGTASGVAPSYTFAEPGTYTVTLTVTDDAGNTGSNETTVTVRDVTPPTVDAGADATIDEDTSLSFSPATATDNVGVTAYSWAFGDGNSSTATSPSHTYAEPGTYTVTLTVTDAAGNTASDTMTVTVRDVTAPTADAGATKTVSVGEAVAFDGSGSTDNVGVTAYSWAFGDGATGEGATTSHTYAEPGTYTATLTASDDAGNAATDSVTVYVSDTTDPVADAGGDRTVTVDESVTFDASASTDDVGIVGYSWGFDDGSTATGETVTTTYATPGEFSVTLTVRDSAGNRVSQTVRVTVEAESTSSSGGGGGGVVSDPTPSSTTPSTATASPGADDAEPVVQRVETDVDAGTPVSVDFSPETVPAERVAVTDVGFTPSVSEPVSLRVTSGRGLDGSPAFDRDDNTALVSNLRVDHSIANADVSDVAIGFRVSDARLDRLGVPAEDVALYRYTDGSWVELPTTVVDETPEGYRFSASSPGLSEFAVGAKQPKFELQSVRIAVDEIRVGDDLQVFVRITNDGGADGTFAANLLIDDTVVESRELTIAAGGRRQVRFERPIGEIGSYTVQVNDAVAGELVVTRERNDVDSTVTAARSTSRPETSTDPALGGSLGAVVGTVVLLVAGIGYVYRRRAD